VGAVVVVLAPIGLEDAPSLDEVAEELAVEKLVTEAGVEGLGVAVLPGSAGRDEESADVETLEVAADGLADELGTVVAANGARCAVAV